MLLLVGLLTACTETVVPQPPQQASFKGPSYVLNVASIDIAEDYQTSKVLPHVEGHADMPPAAVFRDWVAQHVSAGGRAGRAEVVISDAGILRRDLPKQTSGIEGYFTEEQTEEYKGSLQIEIKIYDDRNILPVAQISASSRAMHTLGEKAGLEDHKALYHNMSIELVKVIEPEIEKNIRAHMSNYLM